MTNFYETTRKELESLIKGYSDAIRHSLAEQVGERKVGFVLMLFDYGEKGSFAYAADAQRSDMIALLEEALIKLRRRH